MFLGHLSLSSSSSFFVLKMDSAGDDDTELIQKEVEMSNTDLVIAVLGSSIGNVMEWFDFAMLSSTDNIID